MISPVSGIVLLSAGVVASPALYGAIIEGTVSLDTAVIRYLVIVLIAWACLSLVSTYAWTPAKPKEAALAETPPASLRDTHEPKSAA
jgi:hypothetical protein